MTEAPEDLLIVALGFRGRGYHKRYRGFTGLLRRLLKHLRHKRLDRALGLRITIGGWQTVVDFSRLDEDGLWNLDKPHLMMKGQKIDFEPIPSDADIVPSNMILITRSETP